MFVQAMNGFISILLVLFLTLLDTTILITGFQAVVAPPTVKSTTLLFRTTTLESAPPAATEEKLTKEAQELLDTIAARKNGDENAPELIIAQVAPSVRYVFAIVLIYFVDDVILLPWALTSLTLCLFDVYIESQSLKNLGTLLAATLPDSWSQD